MNDVFDVAIIGGGAAGTMAALRASLNNNRFILFMGDGKSKKRSRAQWVARVDNIPGFSDYKKGILNPNLETIKLMQEGEFKHNFTKVMTTVKSIEKDSHGLFVMTDSKNEKYKANKVVLATGVMDVQPHINGSIDPILPYANNQLIDYCIRCDGHHTYGHDTIVIGHTDSAAWTAVVLHERYQLPSLTILTNGEKPQFSEDLQKLIELYHFKVEIEPITHIRGNPKENILEGLELKNGRFVKAQRGFVSLGTIVYNQLALDLGARVDERGFVITNKKGETNIEGLYAIGDMQAGIKNQIYTSWDSAVDALDDIDNKKRMQKRFKQLEQLKA